MQPEHGRVPFFPFQCAVDGVGLIRQRMHHKQLLSFHGRKILKESQRVKRLATVQKQG